VQTNFEKFFDSLDENQSLVSPLLTFTNTSNEQRRSISATMPKASRANSKKAAPSSKKQAADVLASQPLFEIDTQGSSSVRRTLLADQQPAQARLRKGQSIHKPLRSDLILAQRSDVPALSSRVVPNAEAQAKKNKVKAGKVDRATKERLKRIAGRDGQGEGLWGIKTGDKGEALSDAVKAAGGYDAWKAKEKPSEEEDTAMKEFLAIHDAKKQTGSQGKPLSPVLLFQSYRFSD